MKKVPITKKINVPRKKSTSFQRIMAIAKIGIISTIRIPTSLFFNFVFPFIFITIFGILNWDNISYPVGIRPNSTNNPVVTSLEKVKSLKIEKKLNNNELNAKLKKGEILVVLTVTQNKTQPYYTVLVEKSGASIQSAETASVIIDKVLGEINEPSVAKAKIVQTETKIIAGHKFKAIDQVLPGQLAFALIMNAMFGMAFTFITLKKQLVIKRIFATATTKFDILAGETITRLAIATLQALLILTVGHYVFGYTLINGISSFLAMMALSIIGISAFLPMGFLATSICTSEDSIAAVANLIMMPQMFLSGAFFSLDAFPQAVQKVANVLPMTILNKAFQKIAFEGVALADVRILILEIMAWAVAIYLVDIKLFKWE